MLNIKLILNIIVFTYKLNIKLILNFIVFPGRLRRVYSTVYITKREKKAKTRWTA